jgi:hypothetical protein
VDRVGELGLLLVEEVPDLSSEGGGGNRGDVVPGDNAFFLQAVCRPEGTSVESPRIVVVIGATVTVFM